MIGWEREAKFGVIGVCCGGNAATGEPRELGTCGRDTTP